LEGDEYGLFELEIRASVKMASDLGKI